MASEIIHLISVLTKYKYLLAEQSYHQLNELRTNWGMSLQLTWLRQLERWVMTPADQQQTLETHQTIKSLPTRPKHVYRRPKPSPSSSRRACKVNLTVMITTQTSTATKRGTLTRPSTMMKVLAIDSYRKSEWPCKREITELKEPLARNPAEKHPQPWYLSTRVASGTEDTISPAI